MVHFCDGESVFNSLETRLGYTPRHHCRPPFPAAFALTRVNYGFFFFYFRIKCPKSDKRWLSTFIKCTFVRWYEKHRPAQLENIYSFGYDKTFFLTMSAVVTGFFYYFFFSFSCFKCSTRSHHGCGRDPGKLRIGHLPNDRVRTNRTRAHVL